MGSAGTCFSCPRGIRCQPNPPCSRSLSSLTTMTSFALVQSLMKRSDDAFQYGAGLNCLVRVRKTSRPFRMTSQYALGGLLFSHAGESRLSCTAGDRYEM